MVMFCGIISSEVIQPGQLVEISPGTTCQVRHLHTNNVRHDMNKIMLNTDLKSKWGGHSNYEQAKSMVLSSVLIFTSY
jgi:hypothetical protein